MPDSFSTHNVGELTPVPGTNAHRLSRYPAFLEEAFSLKLGKSQARQSTGCEIRCVPENSVTLLISSPDEAIVQVYQGDFWVQNIELAGGGVQEVRVEPAEKLKGLRKNTHSSLKYSPDLIRLKVQKGTVWLYSVEGFGGGLRPPRPEELPKITWLAWGSSITQADTYGYVHQCANRLGVQVLNKGLSGSCGVEPAVAQWLAQECNWAFATLEWGVNLRGSLEPDAFEFRASESLNHFVATGKPIFLITSFTNDVHLKVAEPETARRQNLYDDILRSLATQAPEHVEIIEGCDVLHDITSLGSDLVHPTHDGQNRMGETLASILNGRHLLSEVLLP
jgi:hypothetical protein